MAPVLPETPFAIGRVAPVLPETPFAIGRVAPVLQETPFAIGRVASALPKTPFAIGRVASALPKTPFAIGDASVENGNDAVPSGHRILRLFYSCSLWIPLLYQVSIQTIFSDREHERAVS
ncbi:hypothetical protein sS8_5535 [Methylocaldum marinum]|uniref:Uncharacterized protein n=1 Tax=Methylocaldum marinum TaxID=1432792 RepID=A0A250L0T4_9GAMM|nr:hypothetical protein sS8_5535 [Methylocaldum marinum]